MTQLDVEYFALLVILGFWVLFVSAVVSAARTPSETWMQINRGKAPTVFLIVITGGVGGLYYWLRIYRELRGVREL